MVRSGPWPDRLSAGSHGLVDVAPAFSRRRVATSTSLADGEEQRGEAGGQRRRKSARAGRAISTTRRAWPSAAAHIRAVCARALLGVDVGPRASNALTGPSLPGARGGHQGGLAAAERRVRVGAGVEQQLDDRRVAVRAGQRERRHAVAVRGLDVGPGVHQELAVSRSS